MMRHGASGARTLIKRAFGAVAALCLLPSLAQAQVFENTQAGAIGDNSLCAGATNAAQGTVANFTRTFNVTGVPSVTQVTFGLAATHSWRGDMRIQLISPQGTTRTLHVADTTNAGNLDNYNVTFLDGTTPTVNQGDHGNDTVVAPFYDKLVAPDQTLAIFNGQNGNGTWTLRMCDDYQGQNGNFQRARLSFLTPGSGDVSTSVTASNRFPQNNGTITATFRADNTGPQTQTGLTANIAIPPGYTVGTVTGAGTLSGSVWTIPNLAAGASAVLDVQLTTNSTSGTVSVDLATANAPDPDSTPGNNDTDEDDYAAVQIFPQPPATPPTLTCQFNPEYAVEFSTTDPNYDWPAGSLSQSYKAITPGMAQNDPDAIDVSMSFAGDTQFFTQLNNVNVPVTQTTYNGGLTGQTLLGIAVDFPSRNESIDLTIALGLPGEGVEGVQFTITDVDLGGWVDRITVTGTADGVPVANPVITPSAQNYVVNGNQVIGRNGNAAAGAADGNAVVTFSEPVDTINFAYDNDPSVQANPDNQIIAMTSLALCKRNLPDISAEKTVEVFDPGNEGLFMTPGNEVLYRIIVTNSDQAQSEADDIDVVDTLPGNLRFVSATTTGFTGGSFDSPVAANTDCENGACVVQFVDATLPIDTVGEVIVRALIK